MVGKRKASDAPSLPPEAQPRGSGAVPGTEGAAEQTFGERMKASAAGEQVQPNDSFMDPELAEDPNTDSELAEEAGEPMVAYRGEFGRREITTEQWAEAGVPNMPTVVWDWRSSFRVPKSVFTEQALQVLRQDQGFQVP
jgi:hypothetical protein